MENLLNQAQLAILHNKSRQRIAQIIKSGELLTRKVGNRTLVIDCKFNHDTISRLTMGSGHWNSCRSGG
jgi:hypothetical protein